MTPLLERRRILWTGGFDSTWMVVDALLQGRRVEAVTWRGYGMNPASWQKPANEDAARRRILHAIGPRLAAKVGELAGTGYPPREFHEAWAQLTEAGRGEGFAPQNYALGALPRITGGPLEAGFVRDDLLSSQDWRREALERMGLSFPILSVSKAELLEDARRRGFERLLLMTWSCEDPYGEARKHQVRTEPCGECEPCLHRIVAQRGRMLDG